MSEADADGSAATSNPVSDTGAGAGGDDIEAAGFRGEDVKLAPNNAFRLKNPNLPMMKLGPGQAHARLVERWSSQSVTATLMATINISLAFGSELLNIDDGFAARWLKPVFVTLSMGAFFANIVGNGTIVQLTADLGRIEDARMAECIQRYGDIFVKLDTSLLGAGTMMTIGQILFAIGAVEPWALPGTVFFFFWFMAKRFKVVIPGEFIYVRSSLSSPARVLTLATDTELCRCQQPNEFAPAEASDS